MKKIIKGDIIAESRKVYDCEEVTGYIDARGADTIEEVITLTTGMYGNDVFKKFFVSCPVTAKRRESRMSLYEPRAKDSISRGAATSRGVHAAP